VRCIVFAYQDVGYVCLEVLLNLGAEVAAVFTHEDDPGENIWFRSVRELAERNGLPVFAPTRLDTGDWLARLEAWAPDFIFSFYYRRLLPPSVLAAARRGALNLHGSLLPKYRGRCPVNWVLVHGERETGVTLHYMEKTADSGDIVEQRHVPITDDDTAHSLYGKLAVAAADLMRETYPALCAGTAPRIPQDAAAATYFGGRKPADGRIDWHQDARQVYNLIRAVAHPYPGAFTYWRGQQLFIWAGKVEAPDVSPPPLPGTVVGTVGGMVVQAGRGQLRATQVQLEGEAERPANEWVRLHAIAPGAILE